MRRYRTTICVILFAATFCCSASSQSREARSNASTEGTRFRPSTVSRDITYQCADTGRVAIWDTTSHFPQANMTSPSVIRKVEPDFPSIAKRAHIEGRILVKAHVNKEGIPEKVLPLLAGVEIFVEPVLEAAREWRFNPPVKDNQPQEFWATLEFNFVFINGSPTVVMPNSASAP